VQKPYCLIPVVAAGLLSIASCAHQPAQVEDPEYWPTNGWITATPQSRDVDPAGIADMFESITSGGYLIDGALIIKDGYLITEAYREPFGRGRRHIIHSCTKSIVSACAGIAIASGHISGTEARLTELFPDADSSGWSPEKRNITLAHLLTMSTGLDTRDSYLYRWEGLTAMRRTPDWVAHALSLPSVTSPGNRFDYSNITSFLLSAALQGATGRTTEDFAREHLFSPMGISDIEWPASPGGISVGWGELRLLPIDLAKIGMLYLHRGQWVDQQILPEEWIDESWTVHMDAETLQPGYGYQWWIDGGDKLALGYRGQYLIVNPQENLIVVFVSTLADDDFYVPQRLYHDYILPAVESGSSAEAAAGADRLQNAIAAYSHPSGPAQTDSVPNAAPPDGVRRRSGTYNLESNAFGMMAMTFEFGATGGAGTVVTEHYADRDDRYLVGLPDEFAVRNSGGAEVGLRGGWFPDGDLQLLFVGIGEAWWTRLRVEFDDNQVEISVNTSSGYTSRFSGTRSNNI
jgi:CubicO group peptidase (beta-lactamase class C family)